MAPPRPLRCTALSVLAAASAVDVAAAGAAAAGSCRGGRGSCGRGAGEVLLLQVKTDRGQVVVGSAGTASSLTDATAAAAADPGSVGESRHTAAAVCATGEYGQTHFTLLPVSPAGTPCVFGVDERDEGSHCIYDEGKYGPYGWCYTSMDAWHWGSCNAHCDAVREQGPGTVDVLLQSEGPEAAEAGEAEEAGTAGEAGEAEEAGGAEDGKNHSGNASGNMSNSSTGHGPFKDETEIKGWGTQVADESTNASNTTEAHNSTKGANRSSSGSDDDGPFKELPGVQGWGSDAANASNVSNGTEPSSSAHKRGELPEGNESEADGSSSASASGSRRNTSAANASEGEGGGKDSHNTPSKGSSSEANNTKGQSSSDVPGANKTHNGTVKGTANTTGTNDTPSRIHGNDSGNSSANSSEANASDDASSDLSRQGSKGNATGNASVCTTKDDERVSSSWYSTSPPGTPCVFGVDPRDEGEHCIYDNGDYGSFGWCYTDASGSSWGSCDENCPLFGYLKVLGDRLERLAAAREHQRHGPGPRDAAKKDKAKAALADEGASWEDGF